MFRRVFRRNGVICCQTDILARGRIRNYSMINKRTAKITLTRNISTLKPNVFRNEPFIPVYAALTTMVILGVLTLYKNYLKKEEQDNEVAIARNDIIDLLQANYAACSEKKDFSNFMAPTLVNLCWSSASTYSRHDFQGGVGGATMRFAPEKDFTFNKGLDRARLFLEPIKEKHPLLTYSDIWTLAAAIAVESTGGPVIPWTSGRLDLKNANAEVTESRCPVAHSGSIEEDIDHIKVLFGRIGGLSYKHIVALFGAHTIGRCHESASGYSGTWTKDETTFSNEYFKRLVGEKWRPKKSNGSQTLQYENEDGSLSMLPIDVALLYDPDFRKHVEFYAANEEEFFKDFATAYALLLHAGVEQETTKRGFMSRYMRGIYNS